MDEVVFYTLSADLTTVGVVKEEGGEPKVRVYKAGEKPQSEDDEDEDVDSEAPGEGSGLVDVEGRIMLLVDVAKEWQQMFYEAWSAAARHSHPSVVERVDADAILDVYETLLPRVSSYAELLDLLNEMCGEMQCSHFGVMPPEEDDAGLGGGGGGGGDVEGQQGHLGATFEWDINGGGFGGGGGGGGAWRIKAMLSGAPWDDRASPPLSRPSVDVRVAIICSPSTSCG